MRRNLRWSVVGGQWWCFHPPLTTSHKPPLRQLHRALVPFRARRRENALDVRPQLLLPPLVAGRQFGGIRVTDVGAIDQRAGSSAVEAGIVAWREIVARLGAARVFLDECARHVGKLIVLRPPSPEGQEG